MKRVLTLAVTAATLTLGSCVDDAYPGLTFIPGENGIVVPSNDEYVNLEKLPVKVRATYQEFFSISSRAGELPATTRGNGPLDTKTTDRQQYFDSKFYVYAFRAANDANIYPKNATMYRMDNRVGISDLSASAYATGRTHDADRNNCLVDGGDYALGAPYKFSADGEGVFVLQSAEHPEDTLYYSGDNRGIGYNFFGYCIDTLSVSRLNAKRTQSGISYEVPIDGTTDLIMGSALPMTDSLASADYKWLDNDKTMRDSILRMNGGYSTTSARASVEPRIVLKHQLTRLQFDLYPADSMAADMVVTGISITVPAKVTMNVAGRSYDSQSFTYNWNNVTTVNLTDDLTKPGRLTQGTSLEYPGGYEMEWKDEWLTKYVDSDGNYAPSKNTEGRVTIGTAGNKACFLVPASGSYEGVLTYKLKANSTAVNKGDEYKAGQEVKMPFALQFTDKKGNALSQYSFEAGTIYSVKLLIYGLREINISASIEGGSAPGWDDSGKIDGNMDDGGWEEK